MKHIHIGKDKLEVPQIALGCMRIPGLGEKKAVRELADKYHVSNTAIAIAWILRHPAGIQAITGSTNKKRIEEIGKAAHVELTREEWYALYMAAGKKLP